MKKYYENYSKAGKKLYDMCMKAAIFLHKNKWLYYTLMFTWGLLMSLVGLITTLCFLIGGQKPHGIYGIWKFEIIEHWGGADLGCMYVRDTTSSDSVDRHEVGHSYQNCLLGPLFPFIVAIPSAIRYWDRVRREKKGETLKPYDAIWFEGSATDIGDELFLEMHE